MNNSNFGIQGFESYFFTSAAEGLSLYKHLLSEIKGAAIEATWVMWDTKENTWMNDGSVIFIVNGHAYEFLAFKLEEYYIGKDRIDRSLPLDWYGMGNELPLEWRSDTLPELQHAKGQIIIDIALVEFKMTLETIDDKYHPERIGQKAETEWMMHGIDFILSKGCVCLFNGLDTNSITDTLYEGREFRRFNV